MQFRKRRAERSPHLSVNPNQPFHQPSQPSEHAEPRLDPPKLSFNRKINAWLKRHAKIFLVFLVLLIAGVGGGLYYLMTHGNYGSGESFKPTVSPPKKIFSPLTGVETDEASAKRPVTGVMIENSPEARPQSGVKEAGMVFESIAEGGITRFLTLYQEAQPGLIGPVRSVRPQYASWVAAYDAGLAHVGGSDIPLAKLRSGQIKDLDQFFNAGAYNRSNDRFAPHNVYTDAARLAALNQSKGYTSSTFTPFKRVKKEAASPAPNARAISVPISSELYNSNYSWDQASNSYLRSQGGQPHIDREKGQIAPKVLIVLQAQYDAIRDSNGYTYPNVIGSGRAWLFQDGTVAEITWSKASDKEPILLKNAAGADVELNPGQTWVVAVRQTTTPAWQ